MERITEAMIERKIKRINELKGVKDPAWNIPGSYLLSCQYGGYSLDLISTDCGGIKDVFSCGHVPKRDLFNRINAYLAGMEN